MLFNRTELGKYAPHLRHAVLSLAKSTDVDFVIVQPKSAQTVKVADQEFFNAVELKQRPPQGKVKAIGNDLKKAAKEVADAKPEWYTFKGSVFALAEKKKSE